MALERAFLDTLLADYVVRPFLQVFRWCDRAERAWTGFLSAGARRPRRNVETVPTYVEQIEELS
jgi:hypothetical protein